MPVVTSYKKNNDLIGTVIDLQSRGFDYDFIPEQEDIICLQRDDRIKKEDFDIIERYQYVHKGKRNKIYDLMALQLRNSDIKGILMTSLIRRAALH